MVSQFIFNTNKQLEFEPESARKIGQEQKQTIYPMISEVARRCMKEVLNDAENLNLEEKVGREDEGKGKGKKHNNSYTSKKIIIL